MQLLCDPLLFGPPWSVACVLNEGLSCFSTLCDFLSRGPRARRASRDDIRRRRRADVHVSERRMSIGSARTWLVASGSSRVARRAQCGFARRLHRRWVPTSRSACPANRSLTTSRLGHRTTRKFLRRHTSSSFVTGYQRATSVHQHRKTTPLTALRSYFNASLSDLPFVPAAHSSAVLCRADLLRSPIPLRVADAPVEPFLIPATGPASQSLSENHVEPPDANMAATCRRPRDRSAASIPLLRLGSSSCLARKACRSAPLESRRLFVRGALPSRAPRSTIQRSRL